MIFYSPTEGDVYAARVDYRPKTCFVMTQIGQPVPEAIVQVRDSLTTFFENNGINVIDATTVVTGRDFLMKIWRLILGVPLGIAIIHHQMTPQTLSNIFYEVGMLHAYGKECLIVKTQGTEVPSDFVRTEYLEFNADFENSLRRYLRHFFSQAHYYASMADQLENNPLLAIDYLRRAYLISGEEDHRVKAREIFEEASIEGRAKNSVERLLASF